ncbi:unnamed protein product [Eruca vesicaria subsp. sativa]|uniref:PB1 domain-containing protein n=1 Tax=Eruca vesicaria subsp. sativa TaxID=29727 RepID=A0ABC8LXL8_ERUVS|nr:unnamed protein product [Eruca vesicaria subsp. sativa]
MEPPPPSLSSTVAPPPPPTHVTSSYPESLESSPRSRTTDALDDLPPSSAAAASSKLRLMCSYGGHILPRPHDKSLCYMGGDTRIVVVDRNSSLSSLVARLSSTLLNNRSFTLKYQLPSEDLDSLISVTTEEDLENMIEEYDRTIITAAGDSIKPSRLRLFLFTEKLEGAQSMGKILESKSKSDDWFLDALNNAGVISRGYSDSDANVNRLLGLDALRSDSDENGNNLDPSVKDDDGSVKSGKQDDGSVKNGKQDDGSVKSVKQQQIEQPPIQGGGQDVQNVADSPILDTSSTSSSPTLANLPPIRVRAEEAGMHDQKVGIEEQFGRFNVESKQQQLTEDGFAAISSPPPMPVTISIPAAPVNATTVSDDERSDHGVSAGFKKPPTPHSQPQNLPPPQGHELPSPNSVSSDNSINNPVFHQKPSLYQEPIPQTPSGSNVVAGNGMINPSDENTLLSQNQNQEPGYIIHPQQSQQQFIHAATPQYIHHHPSLGHPLHTYIHVYPSQQHQQSFHRHPGQPDQHLFPVYYVTPTPYSMHVPQSGSVNEAPVSSLPSNHPQAQPNSTMMPPPPNNHLTSVAPGPGGKPESVVYATSSAMGGSQMVHPIPASQQQFIGYSQIHHPPQSGYEYADNVHKQMYYTLPIGQAQYQTMTGPPPAMVLPDGSTSAKLPAENMSQQIRSSQPL